MGVFEDRDIELTTDEAAEFLALVWFYLGNGMVRRTIARRDDAAIEDMLNRLGITNRNVFNEWMSGLDRHRQAFEEVASYCAINFCKHRPCYSRLRPEAMRDVIRVMRGVIDTYGETGG